MNSKFTPLPSTEVSLHIVLLPCHVFDYLFVDRLQNLTVERMWVEVNSRINYPIKRVLIMMREGQEIEMTDPLTKFCVSFIACNIALVGLSKFVDAWNHHSIPG